MLILTRKKNETIHIGDEIELTIVRVTGNSVRIGIAAPRETTVLRAELQKQDSSPTRRIIDAAA